MDPAIIVSLAVGLLSVVSTITIFFAATHAARVQAHEASLDKQKSVDADAYERARTIYESAIEQLNSEIRRLRTQITEFEVEVTRLQGQILSLRRANAEIQSQLDLIKQANGHTT